MRKNISGEEYEEVVYYSDDEQKAQNDFNKAMEEYEKSKMRRDKEIAREKLYKQSQEKIISKLIEENLMMKLKLNKELPEGNLNTYMKELYLENKGLRDEFVKNEDAKNPIHYFISMRPKENLILFDEFKKYVKKLFEKVWMKDYVFVIEQVGITEDELGKGFHLHAIIKRNDKKPSEVIREIKNTFKHIGDVEDFHFLDIKGIYNNENGLRNRMNYILGDKECDDINMKDIKQKMDIIFRQKKGLENYYFFGEFFSPYIVEVLGCPSKLKEVKNLY